VQIKKNFWLFDYGNEDLISMNRSSQLVVVPDGDDWYIVRPDESVIFLDNKTNMLLEMFD
jgi:hypothetical protein